MNQASSAFRTWLASQRVRGVAPVAVSESNYRIDVGSAVAEVNLWPYENDVEIA